MKMPSKPMSLALGLLLGTTSIGLAASVEKLVATPSVRDAGIMFVADDDDAFRPFWWRKAGPVWQGDWDDDDDDRWDDDDHWDDDDDNDDD